MQVLFAIRLCLGGIGGMEREGIIGIGGNSLQGGCCCSGSGGIFGRVLDIVLHWGVVL